MQQTQDSDTFSFSAMLLAPGISLFLGAALLYFTETRWYFANPGILYSVAAGTFIGVFTYIILAALSRLPIADSIRDIMVQLRPVFSRLSFIQVTVLSLMAGVGEEVLFRGFIQIWLSGFMGIELAILIGAIGFGLLHYASFGYFIITTLIGLALGITYHLTNSLLLVMTWHAVYDVIAIWVISRYPELVGVKV